MAVDQGHRQIGFGTNTILDAVTKRHFLGTDRQYRAVNTVTNGAASGPAVAYPSLSLIQPSRRIGHPARTSQAGEPILMRRVSAPLAWLCMLVTLCAAGARPASAQQTTGIITGRIVDDQGAAVPGATVTGKNAATGFSRTDVSDGEGIFRLNALPVGTYDITTELQGFTKVENKGIVVNVGQTLDLNLTLKLATVQETITVNAETPLIQTSSSSVGGVVDINRIENLPLNGRQFANAAVTIPASASASTPTRPRARSSRRRLAAATAATSTTRSTAATTTTTRSAACCSSSRSRPSRSSTSSPSATRPSTVAATAA